MAGKTPGPEPMLEDKELLRKIKESILAGNEGLNRNTILYETLNADN